jgi:hypothetical protein
MKTAIPSEKSLIATLVLVMIAVMFGLGFATHNEGIGPLAEYEHLIESLTGFPCRIVTSFRTFAERMNPTRSECN